jgi:CHAD domain-containing protein
MPLLEALESILRQRRDGLLSLLQRATVYDPEDTEPIHKVRVGSRRLSAVLEVLEEFLPDKRIGKLSKDVAKIRRACGAARDLDVRRQFLEALLARATEEDAGIIEILCDKLIGRRQRLQKKLAERLHRFERKLHRDGDELLETLATIREQGESNVRPFGAAGVQILLQAMDALWAELYSGSPKDMHRLRIACKRLRYLAEIVFPVLDPILREQYYPQLEQVQQRLGDIHDAAEASDELKKQRKKWRRKRRRGRWNGGGLAAYKKGELHRAVDGVLLEYSRLADEANAQFLVLWPAFAGDAFRLPVTTLLVHASQSGSHQSMGGGPDESAFASTGLRDVSSAIANGKDAEPLPNPPGEVRRENGMQPVRPDGAA